LPEIRFRADLEGVEMPFGMQIAEGDVALTLSAAAATVSSGPVAAAGQAAYVLGLAQVTAITGTSPTVTFSFDESTDASTWTAMTGATTGALSATGSAVWFGKATKNYVRVTATIGGTGPAVTGTAAVIAFPE
jgi:hypothetical protein